MRKRFLCTLYMGVMVGCMAGLVQAQPAPQQQRTCHDRLNETPEQRDVRMTWWRKARFGMFIHWGVYSVPAGTYKGKQIDGIGEWIMRRAEIPVAEYKAFAKKFNPVRYNPDAWAALAEKAGMKYMVITSKHHDGFALFPSDATDWDVADATPYGKDLIGPLAKAARKHGLRFGLYYSQAQDWNHPGGAKAGLKEGEGWDEAHKGDFDEYLKTIAYPQVKEILTRYRPDILWWDTPVWMNKERADLLRPLLRLQPDIIVNNRLGGGYKGDTDTPEQHIPATGIPGRDWEVCMTMNSTWGYKSYDQNWKSVEDLIHKLADIASKGGNFLLNVGPKPDGTIPDASIERLEAIGRWMQVNSEAIYDTTASPFLKLDWGRCTKRLQDRGATLYLHIFNWPSDGRLVVPGLRNAVCSATLLAGHVSLRTETAEEGVVVHLPAEAPDAIDSVVKLEVSGKLDVAKVLPKQAADGTLTLTALQADIHNVFNSDVKVESKYGQSNIGFWLDPKVKVSWQCQVTQPGPFNVIADLATPAEGVTFHVKIGDQTLVAKVESTGDYGQFVSQSLGRITLDAAGECELVIEPDAKHWKPINLRSVTLKPVKSEDR